MVALGMLDKLINLDISGCQGPSYGEFGSALCKLTNLEKLDLSRCEVDGSDLAALTPLKKLGFVRLKGCQASRMTFGLMFLSSCARHLTRLNLTLTEMSDSEMPYLVRTLLS